MKHQLQISTTKEMIAFLDHVKGAMTKCGFHEKDIFSTRLGLEEAIVNAIQHGNKSDPAKKVQLSFIVDADQVIVDVEDEGPGFDPGNVPNPLAPENIEKPGGRGVFLMNSYMTCISFNDKGNRVTLCKERSTTIRNQ